MHTSDTLDQLKRYDMYISAMCWTRLKDRTGWVRFKEKLLARVAARTPAEAFNAVSHLVADIKTPGADNRVWGCDKCYLWKTHARPVRDDLPESSMLDV